MSYLEHRGVHCKSDKFPTVVATAKDSRILKFEVSAPVNKLVVLVYATCVSYTSKLNPICNQLLGTEILNRIITRPNHYGGPTNTGSLG